MLYKATGDGDYLNKATTIANQLGVAWGMSWDDQTVTCQVRYIFIAL